MTTDFILPDIGEGIVECELLGMAGGRKAT